MTDYARYAVFAAPEPGPLADFAARWLGWDAQAGARRAHPAIAGLPRPVADLTRTPRRYGFHATLKPPFRLAAGSTRAGLAQDLASLAASLAPVTLEGIALARLGGFLTLVPAGDCTLLDRMAAEVVARLDGHRAPAPQSELARRRAAGLSPAQEANLRRWGYPFVMDDFRFHFTLTGKLTPSEAEATRTALAPLLAPLLPRPFIIGALCLFGEDENGFFHLLERSPLTG